MVEVGIYHRHDILGGPFSLFQIKLNIKLQFVMSSICTTALLGTQNWCVHCADSKLRHSEMLESCLQS